MTFFYLIFEGVFIFCNKEKSYTVERIVIRKEPSYVRGIGVIIGIALVAFVIYNEFLPKWIGVTISTFPLVVTIIHNFLYKNWVLYNDQFITIKLGGLFWQKTIRSYHIQSVTLEPNDYLEVRHIVYFWFKKEKVVRFDIENVNPKDVEKLYEILVTEGELQASY